VPSLSGPFVDELIAYALDRSPPGRRWPPQSRHRRLQHQLGLRVPEPPHASDDFVKRLIEHTLELSPAPRRWHITRYAMYQGLEGRLAEYDDPEKVMLSVSRSHRLGRIMGLGRVKVERASYPDRDIGHLDDVPAESVDFVIADQVLEHVEAGPFAAFSESRRVVRPGGLVVFTTCLMNEVHQAPMDFWRFTPHGLRRLAEHHDLEVLDLGAWGNREASTFIFYGFRKVLVPEEEGHPVFELTRRNEDRHPIVTWLIARRPE
jgi:SAM-dependent methyltransferase